MCDLQKYFTIQTCLVHHLYPYTIKHILIYLHNIILVYTLEMTEQQQHIQFQWQWWHKGNGEGAGTVVGGYVRAYSGGSGGN